MDKLEKLNTIFRIGREIYNRDFYINRWKDDGKLNDNLREKLKRYEEKNRADIEYCLSLMVEES